MTGPLRSNTLPPPPPLPDRTPHALAETKKKIHKARDINFKPPPPPPLELNGRWNYGMLEKKVQKKSFFFKKNIMITQKKFFIFLRHITVNYSQAISHKCLVYFAYIIVLTGQVGRLICQM